MKNYILALATAIVAIATPFSSLAQEIATALLQSADGSSLAQYTGSNAFKEALAAASEGDLIQLSAGTFNATDINKAVTIQGAGYAVNPAENLYRTTISGTFSIAVPASESPMSLDNVYLNNVVTVRSSLGNASFSHAYFAVNFDLKSSLENCSFYYCRFGKSVNLGSSVSSNVLFDHCIVNEITNGNESSTVTFLNCFLKDAHGQDGYTSGLMGATFKNSIIAFIYSLSNGHKYSGKFHSSVLGFNTLVGVGWFAESNATNCWGINNEANFNALLEDASKGRLTPEAALKYIGTDGSVTGTFGGSKPFTEIPDNPRVTKIEIPAQSDSNGKLKVSITVETTK